MSAYSDAVDALAPNAYWRCNEASGDLLDSTLGGTTLTLNGSATYGVAGAIRGDGDTAVRLSGADANFWLSGGSVSIDVDDIFTLMCWFKKNENGRRQMLMAYENNGPILEVTAANLLALYKNGVAPPVVPSTVAVTDFGWHFVAVTKDGATSAIYLDGVDVSGTVTDATMLTAATSDFGLGKVPGFTGLNWNGSIDEAAIFSSALADTDIAAIYELGRTFDDDDRRRRR